MGSRYCLLTVLAFGVVAARAAGAQPSPAPDSGAAPPPLTLSYADGRVDVVRASGVEPARVPDLLDDDDRLVVADGRAELVYDDGALAHIDRRSDLRIDAGGRLRLVRGRVVLHTAPAGIPLDVATPAGIARLEPGGEYVVTADDLDGDTAIEVVAGRALLVRGDDETPIAADDTLTVDPRDPRPRWSRGAFPDAFRDWSRRRADRTTLDRAAATLPPAVQPWAADFAAYGQWSTISPYGAVWFPNAGPDWRPYTDGSWRYTRYGWTWIDRQRWGWPVHHYGRWGRHDTRGWYWIPQRAWGPAWVSWAMGADHVAWSPLGWDTRPVVDFFAGVRVGPSALWASSWSVVPRQAFGRRGWVGPDLQDPRSLPGPVLGGFVSQMIGPRGPAGADDRFSSRGAFRPRPPAPAIARPPFGGGFDQARPRRADDPRVLDAPRAEEPWRRPQDAPPGAPTAGRPADPRRYREWSTAPAPAPPPAPPDRRGDAPVGPPVPPRTERPAERGSDADGAGRPARESGRPVRERGAGGAASAPSGDSNRAAEPRPAPAGARRRR